MRGHFLQQPVERGIDQQDVTVLRAQETEAERVRDETRQLVRRRFNVELLEGYGATEAAPVISVNQPGRNHHGTVGRPLPGMETKFEAVPGIEKGGRLLVRGPNVMEGYLSPSKPGQLQKLPDGWHDTGDIVVQDDEGYLTIKGRLKRFAKIGGEMVSLAAIEDFVQRTSPDHDHAVVALPDPRKGERIVLVTTDQSLDRDTLLKAARGGGVHEMVIPAEVLHRPDLPLLGTGKTDYPSLQKIVTGYLAAA